MARPLTRCVLVSLLLFAALFMTVGPHSAQAAFGDMSARLLIAPPDPNATYTRWNCPESPPDGVRYCKGYHPVTVRGIVSMSQAEATRLLAEGYKIKIRLWGEDPVSDDLVGQGSPFPSQFVNKRYVRAYASAHGLVYSWTDYHAPGALNEDIGEDEVYAGVRLLKPDGTTTQFVKESNRIHRSFGTYDPGIPYEQRT